MITTTSAPKALTGNRKKKMIPTIKKGRTYLDALNKVRKDKRKAQLKGKGVSKKGPKSLEKMAKNDDKRRKNRSITRTTR